MVMLVEDQFSKNPVVDVTILQQDFSAQGSVVYLWAGYLGWMMCWAMAPTAVMEQPSC